MRTTLSAVNSIVSFIGLCALSLAIAYVNRSDAFVYISMLWLLACIGVMVVARSKLRLPVT